MGCWNGTCGLSQMPIKHGDKVVLFPIMKSDNADNGGSGFVYNHNQYAPISLPLFGEYNDYGSIENITKHGDFVFSLFKQYEKGKRPLLKINEKEHKRQVSINSRYTGTPKSLEELVDTYMGEPVYEGLGYMLVHEDVYQAVLDEISLRKNWRTEQPLRELLEEQGRTFLKEVDEMILNLPSKKESMEEVKEKIAACENEEEKKPFYTELFNYMDAIKIETGDYRDAFEENSFVSHFYQYTPNSSYLRKMIHVLVKEKESREELLRAYIDLLLFDTALDALRKMWIPQAGAGSQGSEYHMHKIIAEKIIEKEKKVIEQWLEDNIPEEGQDLSEITKEWL